MYIFSADSTPELLKLWRVTKVKVFFLVLVYIYNFDLFEFSTATLKKSLFMFEPFRPLSEKLVNSSKSQGEDISPRRVLVIFLFFYLCIYLSLFFFTKGHASKI